MEQLAVLSGRSITADLVCEARAAALEYLDRVATNLSMPTYHTVVS